MENILESEDVISKEIAVKEIQKLVKKWSYDDIDDWKAEEDYPQLLKAIQKGLVTFDENLKPTFKLAFPVKNSDGDESVSIVDFRTRIKPVDLANITDGLNVSKKQVEYTLRCLSYLTQQPKMVLNKFDKFDYKVVEQISTVFF